jgi:5'-nucleotidase
MQILLTNDDGIYAPGLAALEHKLRPLGAVEVIAPLTEQSGVGHSITYLTPLMAREVFHGSEHRGWAVEGSPADCVKLAVAQLCRERPQLVVSGINSGLNAGINVLYSGTVAAAIEGAFFGITSIAVSLEYSDEPHYERAAELAVPIIQQILAQKGERAQLFNLNIPQSALQGTPEVRVAPMCVAPWGEDFEARRDPRGRAYYWASGTQPLTDDRQDNDLAALREGHISVTPLKFDMTNHSELSQMQNWQLGTSVPHESRA